jgi:hypothetical protein
MVLQECQKRPTRVSKEAYKSVKRGLQECQKYKSVKRGPCESMATVERQGQIALSCRWTVGFGGTGSRAREREKAKELIRNDTP